MTNKLKVTHEEVKGYLGLRYCVYEGDKYLKCFKNKDEAIIYAKWYAEQDKSKVVVEQDDEWRIVEEFSCAYDKRMFFVYQELKYHTCLFTLEQARKFIEKYSAPKSSETVWIQGE